MPEENLESFSPGDPDDHRAERDAWPSWRDEDALHLALLVELLPAAHIVSARPAGSVPVVRATAGSLASLLLRAASFSFAGAVPSGSAA